MVFLPRFFAVVLIRAFDASKFEARRRPNSTENEQVRSIVPGRVGRSCHRGGMTCSP